MSNEYYEAEFGDKRLTGFRVVAELPTELGEVTKLEIRDGKVVAHTASGIRFIVPSGPSKEE